ncbi:hypothetical protein M9H77_17821 [Catharanthus roseus]|uniref:Uncharacterized protein n=1 Tax=Catharanthus roseus TaxID=4058 RepID=A0ACC0B5P5_CATRO|nr:hypothetical protein M9H77_17821 [Catharanthus roseus]
MDIHLGDGDYAECQTDGMERLSQYFTYSTQLAKENNYSRFFRYGYMFGSLMTLDRISSPATTDHFSLTHPTHFQDLSPICLAPSQLSKLVEVSALLTSINKDKVRENSSWGREEQRDLVIPKPRGKSKDLTASFKSHLTRVEEGIGAVDAHMENLDQRVEGLEANITETHEEVGEALTKLGESNRVDLQALRDEFIAEVASFLSICGSAKAARLLTRKSKCVTSRWWKKKPSNTNSGDSNSNKELACNNRKGKNPRRKRMLEELGKLMATFVKTERSCRYNLRPTADVRPHPTVGGRCLPNELQQGTNKNGLKRNENEGKRRKTVQAPTTAAGRLQTSQGKQGTETYHATIASRSREWLFYLIIHSLFQSSVDRLLGNELGKFSMTNFP